MEGAELMCGRKDVFAQLVVVPVLPRRFDFGAAAAGDRVEWRHGFVGLEPPRAVAAAPPRGATGGGAREALRRPRRRPRPLDVQPAPARLVPLSPQPKLRLGARQRHGREREDDRGRGVELDTGDDLDAVEELELLGAALQRVGANGSCVSELVAAIGQYDESWEPACKTADALRRLALHAGLDRELRPGEGASDLAPAAARVALERSSAQVIRGLVLAVHQLERRLAHASGPGGEASRRLESGACAAVAHCTKVLMQQQEQEQQDEGGEDQQHERQQRELERLQHPTDSARCVATSVSAATATSAANPSASLSLYMPSSGSPELDGELRALRSAALQLSALHSNAFFNPEKELASLRAVAEAHRLDAERARADLHAADVLVRELKSQVLAGQAARLAALEEHHSAALMHADDRYKAEIGRLKRDKDALMVELRTGRSRRVGAAGGTVETAAA
jgi:hypothetical protein